MSATGRVSAQKGRGRYVADGENVLGATRFGRLFPAHEPGSHLHAVRVPAGPGGRGQQARRDRASPSELRAIRPPCRPAGTATLAAKTRNSRRATTTSISAWLPPRTTSSLSRQYGRRAGCSAIERHRNQGRRRLRGRGSRGARGHLPCHPDREARCCRRGHSLASGQHAQGLPPRDPASRVRRGRAMSPVTEGGARTGHGSADYGGGATTTRSGAIALDQCSGDPAGSGPLGWISGLGIVPAVVIDDVGRAAPLAEALSRPERAGDDRRPDVEVPGAAGNWS